MQSVSIVKFRDRAVVAFKATLIGITVGSALGVSASRLVDVRDPVDITSLGIVYGYVLLATVVLGFPGWLCGFLALVWFGKIHKWRPWALLLIGTLIGPFSVFLEIACATRQITQALDGLLFYGWAAMDAALVTLLYLVLLRRHTWVDREAIAARNW